MSNHALDSIYFGRDELSCQARDTSQLFQGLVHYGLAAYLFALYGTQVCPLLESLSTIHLVLPLLLAGLARQFVVQWATRGTAVYDVQRQFFADLFLFVTAAIGLVVYNSVFHDAPWHSNAKVLVGMGILGFYAALDLSLRQEQLQAEKLICENREINLSQRFSSFSKKFSVMAIVVVSSFSIVLFMVFSKDLTWLFEEGQNVDPKFAKFSILVEVLLIMVTLLGYCLRVIHSYVSNLNMYLSHQNGVLNEVLRGNMSVHVPVISQDEFGRMAKSTNSMINSLRQNQDELRQTRDVSILALASLAETRDNETGAHILRTQHYVKTLAMHLQGHADFQGSLDDDTIELLFKSAPLHDVGKVGIPDDILLKPGKLTDSEFEIMKTHAQKGADALLVAESQLGSNSFLRLAREIAAFHHEKWDGSGYPNGFKEEEIPLSARLMALADVYDALISKRVYKPAFPHDRAKEIILEGKGTHFDPRVVEAFLETEQEFQKIASEYKDTED
ncbi:HD domain-containing phosphohydrolase [Kaarinaea lacus]